MSSSFTVYLTTSLFTTSSPNIDAKTTITSSLSAFPLVASTAILILFFFLFVFDVVASSSSCSSTSSLSSLSSFASTVPTIAPSLSTMCKFPSSPSIITHPPSKLAKNSTVLSPKLVFPPAAASSIDAW